MVGKGGSLAAPVSALEVVSVETCGRMSRSEDVGSDMDKTRQFRDALASMYWLRFSEDDQARLRRMFEETTRRQGAVLE